MSCGPNSTRSSEWDEKQLLPVVLTSRSTRDTQPANRGTSKIFEGGRKLARRLALRVDDSRKAPIESTTREEEVHTGHVGKNVDQRSSHGGLAEENTPRADAAVAGARQLRMPRRRSFPGPVAKKGQDKRRGRVASVSPNGGDYARRTTTASKYRRGPCRGHSRRRHTQRGGGARPDDRSRI
ncbi:hypothetical protein THAOC_18277 [Thalassiosira oceanica]|uniref:Uncharacterized protein n=1 Tax=Thalassiosira oceanica TaxID=159749 RepID=K0SJV3_THAOC|nr:hypothetical protein THAOC_18277 [Thalassiosira oceanica]|eukprot:EJK61271.1 hypothetical protein THAOC_18277 [Thalassiosira oceanica]